MFTNILSTMVLCRQNIKQYNIILYCHSNCQQILYHLCTIYCYSNKQVKFPNTHILQTVIISEVSHVQSIQYMLRCNRNKQCTYKNVSAKIMAIGCITCIDYIEQQVIYHTYTAYSHNKSSGSYTIHTLYYVIVTPVVHTPYIHCILSQ